MKVGVFSVILGQLKLEEADDRARGIGEGHALPAEHRARRGEGRSDVGVNAMIAPRQIHNLALIGFMGTGKPSVGRIVAAALGCELADTGLRNLREVADRVLHQLKVARARPQPPLSPPPLHPNHP